MYSFLIPDSGGFQIAPACAHGAWRERRKGRGHAIGRVVEATLPLLGDAGPRQLPNVHATVVNKGAITLSGAMVLHN